MTAPLARLLEGVAGHVTPYDTRYFSEEDARHRLLRQFEVASLEGFGCAHLPLAIRPQVPSWPMYRTHKRVYSQQLNALETYFTNGFMTLDPYTRRNLELFETGRGGSVKAHCSGSWTNTHSYGRPLTPTLDRSAAT